MEDGSSFSDKVVIFRHKTCRFAKFFVYLHYGILYRYPPYAVKSDTVGFRIFGAMRALFLVIGGSCDSNLTFSFRTEKGVWRFRFSRLL